MGVLCPENEEEEEDVVLNRNNTTLICYNIQISALITQATLMVQQRMEGRGSRGGGREEGVLS